MKLEDMNFTRKQADRILAEAAEREARQYQVDVEEGEKIPYNQLVQIAQEAQIDPKYLKVSTKQLVRETGGLEKAAVGSMVKKIKEFSCDLLKGSIKAIFITPFWLIELFKFADEDDSYHAFTSAVGGVPGIFAYYGFAIEQPEYRIPLLTLGAITNVSSVLYGWYIYEKYKLIEEMNGDTETTEAQR